MWMWIAKPSVPVFPRFKRLRNQCLPIIDWDGLTLILVDLHCGASRLAICNFECNLFYSVLSDYRGKRKESDIGEPLSKME